ncbi:MAG TPA: SDR family NAD(P)-dependent oxidoreductase [Candidatus Tumulicola sp.]|nr:SDR family NAD(P)-dependent oxidoreductase [Candidatus Tumulicola sp.]
MQISGNVALVTGAASGLGAATAARLRAAGAQVVLADLQPVDAGDGDRYVRCDVTSEDDVLAATQAAADLGRFAMCVHCAGGGIAARTISRDGTPHALDAFRRVIELNLVGTFNVLRLAASQMSHNEPDDNGERGACVLTASIAGYEGQIGQIAYGSAKGGVIGMTIIAARDLSAAGVRVCTIAPGTFATPPMLMVPDAMREAFEANVPFPKRFGDPGEYAALAQHIVENGYLNGEVIRLDGAVRFQPR